MASNNCELSSCKCCCKEKDEKFMGIAIECSKKAVENGDHPFGAILVHSKTNEIVLKAYNTVNTDNDRTKHAELNLSSMASNKFNREFLKECCLYTSTEPCIMCCGAIFWVGIGKVVYGCSSQKLREIVHRKTEGRNLKESGSLTIACKEIFENYSKGLTIGLDGPILEEEAAKVHELYW
ncbi:hypothetical protein ABK040_002632 [Willaertia magna]